VKGGSGKDKSALVSAGVKSHNSCGSSKAEPLTATKSGKQKENRETSVCDVEPDSEEENSTRKQFLHNVKGERAVTRRRRLTNQAEPSESGKQVRRSLSCKTVSSKSQPNEINETPVPQRLTFTSAVVGTDGDDREDQAVTLSSLAADEPKMEINRGTNADSKHKTSASSKRGLKGRKTWCSSRVSAADEKEKKVGSSGSNPTCSLAVFDGGDGPTTCAKAVVCIKRLVYDTAALSALGGFSSSSFFTSTSLPPGKRSLLVDPQHADSGDTVATDLLVSRKASMNEDYSSRAVSIPDRSNASNKLGSPRATIKSTGKLETAAKRKRKRCQLVVLGAKRRRLTSNRSAKKSVRNLDTGFYFICLLACVCF
jgi:hypothetical protein